MSDLQQANQEGKQEILDLKYMRKTDQDKLVQLEKAREEDHSRLIRLENMFKCFDNGNDVTEAVASGSMPGLSDQSGPSNKKPRMG